MQIDAKYLINFITPLGGYIILALIVKLARYNSSDQPSIPDQIINMLKMAVYGFLAGYIYLKVKISGLTEIDVLTFFTFVLASMESAHNFVNSLGAFMVNGIRAIYDFVKLMKE